MNPTTEKPKWFVRPLDGERIGPVSDSTLRSMAENGTLDRRFHVWREGMDDWVPAFKIQGLFVSPPSPDPARINAGRESNYALSPAGFWIRLLAWFLDFLLVIVLQSIASCLFIVSVSAFISPGQAENEAVSTTIFIIIQFLSVITWWLYFSGFESSHKQSTVGKLACGLRVVSLGGERIGFGQATGRHFAKFLSGIPLGIGYLWIFLSEDRQGWHDSLAGTLVIHAPEDSAPTSA